MKIDFAQGMVQTLYADVPEDGTLPEVVECDSVATCAVMIRTEAIRKDHIGIIPEDNFIYWDDTEWGTSDASCRVSDGDFGGSESLTSDGSE